MPKSWIIQCLARQMVPSGPEQYAEFHWMHNEVAHRTREPSVQLGHAHLEFEHDYSTGIAVPHGRVLSPF